SLSVDEDSVAVATATIVGLTGRIAEDLEVVDQFRAGRYAARGGGGSCGERQREQDGAHAGEMHAGFCQRVEHRVLLSAGVTGRRSRERGDASPALEALAGGQLPGRPRDSTEEARAVLRPALRVRDGASPPYAIAHARPLQ